MSTFNPQENLSDWIQDDWESDDYIETTSNIPRKNIQETKSKQKDSAWLWVLAVMLYFIKSPLFWIAVLIIGFIKG